jgi:hypothetical protein
MDPVRKQTDNIFMTIERCIAVLSKVANHGLLAF